MTWATSSRATCLKGRSSRTLVHDDSGTALVEFALVVPLFALMLFAMIQFGIAFAGWDQLRNRVQLAARQAAMGGLACSTVPACDNAIASNIGDPLGTTGAPTVAFYYGPGSSGPGSYEVVVCAWVSVQDVAGLLKPMTFASTSAFYVEQQAQLPTSSPANCGP